VSKKSANWRIWSAAVVLALSIVMIWPTVKWYSLPQEERDRAEASVQPETHNPQLRQILSDLQQEGGEDLIEQYRQLYNTSTGTLKLGLDLQGGMYLSYTVEPTPGLDADEALDQALEVIRNRIDEFGVSEPSITRQGSDRIIVQLPGVRDPARARAIVERQALLEFKMVAYPSDEHPAPASVPVIRAIESYMGTDSGGGGAEDSLSLPVADEEIDLPSTEELTLPSTGELTLPALPGEEELSLPDLTVEPQDEIDEFELQVSGGFASLMHSANSDVARVLSISPGDWTVSTGDDLDRFNDVINNPGVDSILAEANLMFTMGRPTETSEGEMVSVFLTPADVTRGWERLIDTETPHYHLTGANLTDVRIRVGGDQSMRQDPYLILEFDSEGTSRWERITGENVDKRVAVVLDGTIYSVATIRERISSSGTRLSGGFSVEEARDLRLVLKAGSLPAKLVIAEEQTIGPSLGRRSINHGMIAAIIGIGLIAAFMIIYYGTGGVLAILALIFDMLIIMAVLCFPGPFAHLGLAGLNAALTLPGIAGIILTIGMAVDASVLIFERIREERLAGKGIRTAVEAGYDHADHRAGSVPFRHWPHPGICSHVIHRNSGQHVLLSGVHEGGHRADIEKPEADKLKPRKAGYSKGRALQDSDPQKEDVHRLCRDDRDRDSGLHHQWRSESLDRFHGRTGNKRYQFRGDCLRRSCFTTGGSGLGKRPGPGAGGLQRRWFCIHRADLDQRQGSGLQRPGDLRLHFHGAGRGTG